MDVVILAATHETGLMERADAKAAASSLASRRRADREGSPYVEVPRPLVDLEGKPLLTILVERVRQLQDVEQIHVVTNEAIRQDLEDWAAGLAGELKRVEVLSDGTLLLEDALGAVGDLLLAVRRLELRGSLLVIGGDNWFTYDLGEFVARSRDRSPAMVLTRRQPGWPCARFGMAQVDEQGRVTEFAEKPEATSLPYKSSCVYYFAADDLKWLDAFAQEHPTRCTPGIFLAWLVPQTPVYGVVMDARWYDIGEPVSSELRGPDFLAFRDTLRRALRPAYATWQRQAARRMQWVSSHEELLDFLADGDPNVRIVAARLLGRTAGLLSAEGRRKACAALLDLLGDAEMNRYGYDGFQDDENSAFYVCATAAESLVHLGYAGDAAGVFQKARAEGRRVEVRRNQP